MNKLAATALLALAVQACAPDEATHVERTAGTERGTPVEMVAIPTVVRVNGDVRPTARAELATRVMARVTAVTADLGARVGTGQTLIRLGLDDIAAARRRAQAAVRLAEAAREEAARNAARMDTLLAQDVVARVQRDQAHLALTRAETDVAMALAALDEVEASAAYTEIRAPFTGVVVQRSVDVGDLAAPGMPLLVLERSGPREAVLAVPTDVAAALAVGDSVAVSAPDGRKGHAVVRVVAGGADPMTRTVEVKAELPADWATGTVITAWVETGTHQGIAVPADAIVRRGQLTGVEVIQDGRNVTRWVRLGRELPDGRIEVLSGLSAGERIVE